MFARKTLAAVVAGLTLSQAALAAAPFDQTPAPGIYRMMLGQFQVTALSDGTVTIPLDKLLTEIKPATLAASLRDAHLQPMTETSINAFLINTGKQLVLVDTGAGDLFGLPRGAQAGPACAMPAMPPNRSTRCCSRISMPTIRAACRMTASGCFRTRKCMWTVTTATSG